MSRNIKPGITFYRKDSGHITHPKVRLLVNEYDSDGYYIWCCLLDYAYGRWGYYFDMNDQDELELFATDYCRKKLSLIKEVIAGCIRRGLFDKTVADLFGVLTCDFMQEVFVYATADRRKKGSIFEMQEKWLLIDFQGQIPGNITIVPGKKEIVLGKNPQTKQNKTETKQELSAPPTAAPPEVVSKKSKKKVKNEEPPEPYWQSLVDVWFDFGVEKFGVKPSFFGRDPKLFSDIVKRLRLRTVEKNKPWDEVSAPKRVRAFLDACFADQWICKNFLLKNIHTQFDKFIQSQEQAFAQKKQQVTAKASVPKTFQDEVNYFFSRYQEGELNQNLMSDDFCRKFILQYDIPTEVIESIKLPTELEKMRAAIVSFFRQRSELKKQEVPA